MCLCACVYASVRVSVCVLHVLFPCANGLWLVRIVHVEGANILGADT